MIVIVTLAEVPADKDRERSEAETVEQVDMGGQDVDNMEGGDAQLHRAQDLVLARRFVEAEEPLLEAEKAFRSASNAPKLDEVLITLSKIHLCEGRPSLALDDLGRAPGADGRSLEAEERILFQKGMALLVMGREEDAHRALTRYIQLAEESDDGHAQAMGHYYLALVYERHGEPCMASAELEIGREATQANDDYILARMNAFLAHLWLRRLAIEEAQPEVEEALRRISSISIDTRPSSIGIVNLVDAEFHAAKSDWTASREKFDLAVRILRGSGMGIFLEAVAHSWYGEILLALGRTAEGVAFLEKAIGLFESLGNSSQADRMRKIIVGGPDAGKNRSSG